MIYANTFDGASDSEIIEAALRNLDAERTLVISAKEDGSPWLLDWAILLPGDVTVILRNCSLKLSDRCRDNFFRSANCGLGIKDVKPLRNIRIRGEGTVILEGADRPRAAGDGSKFLSDPCPYLRGRFVTEESLALADWVPAERKFADRLTVQDRHGRSFGTDAGKAGESQKGDWRGIGILLANVEGFEIENVTLKDTHGWGISLEGCSFGEVRRIHFDDRMYKVIDGLAHNMENQDGIDLRNGCHDILLSDITGRTGDDVVALTAIARDDGYRGGGLCTTHVMQHDWSERDRGIYNVTVRNVVATSCCCYLVRLLAVNSQIRNVVIDGIVDTAPERDHWGAVLLGEPDFEYGVNPSDGIDSVTVTNVISNGHGSAVRILGGIANSVISNVINKNPQTECIEVREGVSPKQIVISNAITVQ